MGGAKLNQDIQYKNIWVLMVNIRNRESKVAILESIESSTLSPKDGAHEQAVLVDLMRKGFQISEQDFSKILNELVKDGYVIKNPLRKGFLLTTDGREDLKLKKYEEAIISAMPKDGSIIENLVLVSTVQSSMLFFVERDFHKVKNRLVSAGVIAKEGKNSRQIFLMEARKDSLIEECKIDILKSLPSNGNPVGNSTLLKTLGSSSPCRFDSVFEAAKDSLVASGRISKGKGRGGSIKLATLDVSYIADRAIEDSQISSIEKPDKEIDELYDSDKVETTPSSNADYDRIYVRRLLKESIRSNDIHLIRRNLLYIIELLGFEKGS